MVSVRAGCTMGHSTRRINGGKEKNRMSDMLPFKPRRIPSPEEVGREREYLDRRERLALALASTPMHTVIERMQNYKKSVGQSDEKFARDIDVSKTTVYRWRTGEVRPPSGMLALALATLERRNGLKWDEVLETHTVKD